MSREGAACQGKKGEEIKQARQAETCHRTSRCTALAAFRVAGGKNLIETGMKVEKQRSCGSCLEEADGFVTYFCKTLFIVQ